MSKLYKYASQSNFYQTQTIPKFNPKTQNNVQYLPNYNDWLGTNEGNTLLNTLKQENTILKEHNQTIEGYLKNVVKVFDSLSLENQNLRKEIESRTLDLQRVIESTATNQALNEKDLKHQIALYEEELRVINAHFSEVRGDDTAIQNKLLEKNVQLEKAQGVIQQLEKNLNGMYQREKDATNELATKNLRIQELTDQFNELQRKTKPLDDKVRSLLTQNDLLNQKVQHLEQTKSKLEKDSTEKINQMFNDNYQKTTDIEHLKHLCSTQEVIIKELKQELNAIKNENYPQQVIQLKQEIQNNQQELKLEQKRHKNAQQREQQNYNSYTTTKILLDELQNKYNLLLMELEKLKAESERDLQNYQTKLQQNLEKQKLLYQQQIMELNSDIMRLEMKIKELNLLIDSQEKELKAKDTQLLEMKQIKLDLDNAKRETIEQKTIIIQNQNKFELTIQQLNDKLDVQQKKYQDSEDRYNNIQEAYKREQERSDQLNSQYEQLKWYQEQYDELAGKIQDMKIEKDDYKREINVYQSKINKLEIENEDIKRQFQDYEYQIKNLETQVRFLEKKNADIEILKQENKILRENKSKEMLTLQTTNPTNRRQSSVQKPEEYVSDTKNPANIYTRGFNVNSNKTLTTMPSNQQLKQNQQDAKSAINQEANNKDIDLKNYPYRTYHKKLY